jgi:hypothetical protein
MLLFSMRDENSKRSQVQLCQLDASELATYNSKNPILPNMFCLLATIPHVAYMLEQMKSIEVNILYSYFVQRSALTVKPPYNEVLETKKITSLQKKKKNYEI